MLKLSRVKENPILTPSDLSWEDMQVFNPGAFVLNNEICLLYRAIGSTDRISRFGLAKSSDGIHFKKQEQPIYSGMGFESETLGIEDPRVIKIDDIFYLIYTAVSENAEAKENKKLNVPIGKIAKVALSTTKDFDQFFDFGVIIPDISGKDASLFPRKINNKYCLLFRDSQGLTQIATSERFDYWPNRFPLFKTRLGMWDSVRTGIGSPPIETSKGWLVFYHGVDESNIYRMGIFFLDLENPTRIIYRSSFPIFEPEEDFEKFGFVPNVVFSCGAVEKDNKYFIYYGAADETIGLATVEKEQILKLF